MILIYTTETSNQNGKLKCESVESIVHNSTENVVNRSAGWTKGADLRYYRVQITPVVHSVCEKLVLFY